MSTIPQDLHDALDQGALIVCAGPQVATAAGIVSRDQLAARLLTAARDQDPHLDARAIAATLESGRAAEALDPLLHVLGGGFHPLVEQHLSDHGHPVPPLVIALASLADRLRAHAG